MLAAALTLDPSVRPGGLLSVANPFPPGFNWTRGVYVMIGSVLSPVRVGPCDVGADDPEPRGEVASFSAVALRQGVLCSMLGRPDTAEYARRALMATAEFALSEELYDGLGTGNPSLTDGPIALGSSSDVGAALALLEDAANTALSGRLAVIHVPLGVAGRLGDAVWRDGARWRTHAGNLVAIHGSGTNMYVTGEVWAGVGSMETHRYDNHAVNTSEGWADAAAIAVFDPEFVGVVEVDPPCECGS